MSLSLWDLRRRPGLSTHLGDNLLAWEGRDEQGERVPDLLCGFFFGFPTVRSDRVSYLVCDSCSCGTGAEDYHSHVFQLELADVQTGHDCCEGDATCSLDIVVEAWNGGSVAIEDSSSWKDGVSH